MLLDYTLDQKYKIIVHENISDFHVIVTSIYLLKQYDFTSNVKYLIYSNFLNDLLRSFVSAN